jgi:hypothetical protein
VKALLEGAAIFSVSVESDPASVFVPYLRLPVKKNEPIDEPKAAGKSTADFPKSLQTF